MQTIITEYLDILCIESNANCHIIRIHQKYIWIVVLLKNIVYALVGTQNRQTQIQFANKQIQIS